MCILMQLTVENSNLNCFDQIVQNVEERKCLPQRYPATFQKQGIGLVFLLFILVGVLSVSSAHFLFTSCLSVRKPVTIIFPTVMAHMLEAIVISCLRTLTLLVGHADCDILLFGELRGFVGLLWMA